MLVPDSSQYLNSKLTVHEIIEVSCGGLSENQDADRFHG